jgi:hypothetical protein
MDSDNTPSTSAEQWIRRRTADGSRPSGEVPEGRPQRKRRLLIPPLEKRRKLSEDKGKRCSNRKIIKNTMTIRRNRISLYTKLDSDNDFII